MRIFLAGASGAIGRTLVPLLVQEQHEVYGAFRNPAHQERVQSLGATPVVLDALDGQAVNHILGEIQPQVVIHQLTAIPAHLDLRHIDRDFEPTNRLRTEGTRNLATAAVHAGVEKFIAQSFAGWPYARRGIILKTEEDDLDPTPPPKMKAMLDAIEALEHTVLRERGFTGIVLRYGPLYGPHSSIASDGTMVEDLRMHKIPLIGQGTGVWSFLHLHDAATATVAALTHAQHGIYNIVDDDPAPVLEWLPFLAQCVNAKPPMHIPNWLATAAVGEHAVALMNDIRGVSNAKARKELNWTPKWSSWRQGFREGL
ncbi:NAD-dependent epimerase/dehydratase family protein [Edaphobacter modestus]|uniref:Nucleoside-diphosphate-sugar epimerase n=1 Tax=Edaphobacter modestus TaxID=388466 RepID=A0A4Q7YX54_9BACT|nr:NAD(P)-dependent oxidoreductase [Edaphobacter modestus]RZU42004.1 nucleoside-diphosphate-sugar epimerase [Edaphobacter modestus]